MSIRTPFGKRLALPFIVALPLVPTEVRAQASDPTPGEAVFTDSRRWNVQLVGNAIIDVTNRDAQLYGPVVGAGYYVFDNLAINVELSGLTVEQEQDTGAWAATLLLRHHVHDFSAGAATVFVDVGGGVFEADDPVPAGGTTFNWTFHVGPGLTQRVADGIYLVAGARYFHLSNANRDGKDRNPSLNGPLFFAGVMFTF
jgi:hypothetical protein